MKKMLNDIEILKMLQSGEITVDEADKMLKVAESNAQADKITSDIADKKALLLEIRQLREEVEVLKEQYESSSSGINTDDCEDILGECEDMLCECEGMRDECQSLVDECREFINNTNACAAEKITRRDFEELLESVLIVKAVLDNMKLDGIKLNLSDNMEQAVYRYFSRGGSKNQPNVVPYGLKHFSFDEKERDSWQRAYRTS